MRLFALTDRRPDSSAYRCEPEFEPAHLPPLPPLRAAASGSVYRSSEPGDEGESSADASAEFGNAVEPAFDRCRLDRGEQAKNRRLSKGDRFQAPEAQDPPPRVVEEDPFDPRSPFSSIPIGLVRPFADRSPNPSPMPPFALTDRRPDSAADEGGPEFDPARPLPPLPLRTAASGSVYRSGGLGDEGELSVDASFEIVTTADPALDHGKRMKDRRPSPKKVLFECPKRKALPDAILLLPAHWLHRS